MKIKTNLFVSVLYLKKIVPYEIRNLDGVKKSIKNNITLAILIEIELVKL